MKKLLSALFTVSLVAAFAPLANAGVTTVTRTVTTTTGGDCRDFTRTTNYVNRTVSTTGTACLFADGAWHDVSTPGQPIVQYNTPVIVEQPVVYAEPEYVPVPVYGGFGYYDRPGHYGPGYGRGGYGRGGYGGRGGIGYNISIGGRL